MTDSNQLEPILLAYAMEDQTTQYAVVSNPDQPLTGVVGHGCIIERRSIVGGPYWIDPRQAERLFPGYASQAEIDRAIYIGKD